MTKAGKFEELEVLACLDDNKEREGKDARHGTCNGACAAMCDPFPQAVDVALTLGKSGDVRPVACQDRPCVSQRFNIPCEPLKVRVCGEESLQLLQVLLGGSLALGAEECHRRSRGTGGKCHDGRCC